MNGSRIKTWALISLALNMALGGALLGRGMHCGRPGGDAADHGGGPRHPFEEALSRLPADKAALLREKWRAARGSGDEESRRRERDELAALLEAPVFDVEAYKRRSDQMTQDRADRMRRVRDAVADMASGMNQEERKILADSLRARPRPPSPPPPGENTPPPPTGEKVPPPPPAGR